MTVVLRRRKPIDVPTVQWTGDNEAEVQEFTGPGVFRAIPAEERTSTPEITASVYDRLHDSWIGVYTGQHIVKGGRGEHYPIDETALADDYDPPETSSDVFQAGHTYADPDGYDWRFRCDVITTHPRNGERTALGWRFFHGEWEPCAYPEDDWDVHQAAGLTDVTEEVTR